MKFGCHLPMFGSMATRETVLGFARRMEDLGYDSLWVSDHVVLPHRIRSRYPYNETGRFPLPPETPFLEPLTTLALVAGVTDCLGQDEKTATVVDDVYTGNGDCHG